jgi:adenylate kinase
MNILVFGAQGSGKSTHAKYIADKLGLPYVYTGDLFRKLAKADSPFGQQIRERLDRGLMQPNPIATKAFRQYLGSLDLSKGVVLDGYPRNFAQALSLPVGIDLVIYIILPEKIAIERLLKRGRQDDTPGSIRRRLDHYKKETAPLLTHFRIKGAAVVEVDNTPPIGVVQKKIDGLLKNQRRNQENS